METPEDLITRMYKAFNERDMETILAALHPDVVWSNGMEGGYIYGRAAVREYWAQQWQLIDPRVEPVAITRDDAGQIHVDVHQTVRNLQGNVLADRHVEHVYQITNSLVERMDITPS